LDVSGSLVQAGLGAVVATQFSLDDKAFSVFAREFYSSVARLDPVDLAVSRVREGLMVHSGDDSRDWAAPVLFSQVPDGVVFSPP
jgi:hypothetical protein